MMYRRVLLTLLLFGVICMLPGGGHVAPSPVDPRAPADNRLFNRIMRDIKRVYGNDLSRPTYDLVNSATLNDPGYSTEDGVRPPSEIINELKGNGFALNERKCADNADLCFAYCIEKTDTRSGKKSSWILMISRVGPYAILFRDLGRNKSEYVPNKPAQQFPMEKPIAETLNRGRYILMNSPTLSLPVNGLSLENTRGTARVYHALFRDTPGLPQVRG